MSQASGKQKRRPVQSRREQSHSGERPGLNATEERTSQSHFATGVGRATGDQNRAQGDVWERFWLQPSEYGWLRVSRFVMAATALLVFVNQWSDIVLWFGDGGLLATDRLGRLVSASEAESLAQWQLTPMYWLSTAWGLRLWLIVGMVASLLALLGRGGRWAMGICWLTTIWLANRQWIVLGVVEYPLALGLLGLTISGVGCAGLDWKHTLGRRLLQVQGLALVAAVALTQWYWGGWLQGEGFQRLVTGGADRIVDLSFLASSPQLSRVFGLLVVVLPIFAVIAWIATGVVGRLRCYRNGAAWLLVGHAVVTAGLADQWLYGAALAGLLLTLVEPTAAGPTQSSKRTAAIA